MFKNNTTLYSPVFYKKRGDKLSLYIDESNNLNFPNRANTLICSNLVLKDIRDGEMDVDMYGIMRYKIAVFEKTHNISIEFIQFEDGIGSMVEIYKDTYVCDDVIYKSNPLNYTIFEKLDNNNHYYEYVINNSIVKSRDLDCYITLYSDLYNIKCAMDDDKTIQFTQNENRDF